ncbi:MAG: SUMF1/EgtB/PvdO family nonheme iron enzyme [Armatimonadetes bacterium]|nr:SUMF1/EgtB/PvdO family nonheme iron enzyme [Armatimonadota bacterium]
MPAGSITVAGQKVEIKPFWIGETEVLWDLYDVFAYRLDLPPDQRGAEKEGVSRPSKPYGAADRGFGHQGYPALGMTSQSAEVFCKWLAAKTGKKYRLPTEAEWEYAARAGAQREPAADEVSWNVSNSGEKTHPAKSKKANAWGLYDVLGNAGEWAMGLDGKPVLCGGTYEDDPDRMLFSTRDHYDLSWQERDAQFPKSKWWLSDGPFVGCRLVCDP